MYKRFVVVLIYIWVTRSGLCWHALIDLDDYISMYKTSTSSGHTNDSTGHVTNETSLTHPIPNVTDHSKVLLEIPGTRFSILRKRVSWPEAVTFCQQNNLRLVTLPQSSDALSLVNSIKGISQPYFDGYEDFTKMYEFGMDRRYWIGLTDMVVEGDWEWTAEGYMLRYQDMWYKNQPDHLRKTPHTSEHCVSLWNPGYEYGDTHTFNDDDCTKMYYAICGTQPPLLRALVRDRDINRYASQEIEKIGKASKGNIKTSTPSQEIKKPGVAVQSKHTQTEVVGQKDLKSKEVVGQKDLKSKEEIGHNHLKPIEVEGHNHLKPLEVVGHNHLKPIEMESHKHLKSMEVEGDNHLKSMEVVGHNDLKSESIECSDEDTTTTHKPKHKKHEILFAESITNHH